MERRTGVRIMDSKLGSLSRIALINGRYIAAFSSNPDGVQGMTGHCIVDEWSKGDVDPEELLAQAASITASNPGFKVMLASNADMN
jgi:phage FluMu gp28-like protein